jgi:hypothetical protein
MSYRIWDSAESDFGKRAASSDRPAIRPSTVGTGRGERDPPKLEIFPKPESIPARSARSEMRTADPLATPSDIASARK